MGSCKNSSCTDIMPRCFWLVLRSWGQREVELIPGKGKRHLSELPE